MAARAFLFGKLPAHGDFVSRGLDDRARDAWDRLAGDMLGALRAQAQDFDAAHAAAAPWRFAAGPSALGPGWRAGALSPSVDAAGRRFLLVAGLDGLSPQEAGALGVPAAEACESMIYDALGGAATADLLHEGLGRFAEDLFDTSAAPADALGATPARDGAWWTLGTTARPPACLSGALPPDLAARAFPGPSPESAR